MFRRVLIILLFVSALPVPPVPLVRAIDDSPDPRPIVPEVVDPDGLEGIHAGGAYPSQEEAVPESPGAKALVRTLYLFVRLVGL